MMHPPIEWTKKWAAENPRQALAVLAFGALQVAFTIWIIASDGCR
jgi:hypothetical protein